MSENIEEQLNNNDDNNDLNMDELLNEQNDDDLLIPLNEQFESINNNISNLKNQNNQKSELLNKMEYLQESIFQSSGYIAIQRHHTVHASRFKCTENCRQTSCTFQSFANRG